MFETSTVSRLGICGASDVCSHEQDSMVRWQVLEDCWDFDDTGQRPPGIKPCAEQRHYSSKESFGRDIVAELIAAARKEGIHPGLYFSHADWYLLRQMLLSACLSPFRSTGFLGGAGTIRTCGSIRSTRLCKVTSSLAASAPPARRSSTTVRRIQSAGGAGC